MRLKYLPIRQYWTNPEIDRIKLCAIYFLLNDNEIVYIGKSTNLKFRIAEHKSYPRFFNLIRFIECPIDLLDYYESRWMLRFRPSHNKYIPHINSKKLFVERIA